MTYTMQHHRETMETFKISNCMMDVFTQSHIPGKMKRNNRTSIRDVTVILK